MAMPMISFPSLPSSLPSLSSCREYVDTSILFGALHYSNGGMFVVFAVTVAGINFGLLKEKVGLLSSITAHGVTNGLLTVVDFVTTP